MKNILLIFSFLPLTYFLHAQYSFRIVVTDVGAKKLDDIYVAGNFNNWNPGDANYKLKPFGPVRRAVVIKDIAAGQYEFKFTRGTWEKVETTAKGEFVANHSVTVNSDTSLEFTIPGWQDDYPDKPKPNTATAQVQILDTAFFMPQLNRYRRIWIYLPKSYKKSTKKYPVLYMQDGQNLFSEQTAPFGEWGVDECLDTMTKECIAVGIDNGGDKRTTEYNAYDNEKYGNGEGDEYADFLVQTLKPYIDSKFRTLKDAQHTYVAGSSLGALISLYAVVKYPNIFGKAGVFSPAFWIAPNLYSDVSRAKWNTTQHFYFYAGTKESDEMVNDMRKMESIIKQKNCCFSKEVISTTGKHNEKFWREEFDDFYKWLMQ